jgi:hypothetical protein
MDPDADPGGPKTCGSGSPTLLLNNTDWLINIFAPNCRIFSIFVKNVPLFSENSVSFLLDEAFLDIESYFSDLLTSKWQTGERSSLKSQDADPPPFLYA